MKFESNFISADISLPQTVIKQKFGFTGYFMSRKPADILAEI